jgi:hypothetical protein
MIIYLALLFMCFVPGMVFTAPGCKSKLCAVAIHAVLFAFVFYVTKKVVVKTCDKVKYGMIL